MIRLKLHLHPLSIAKILTLASLTYLLSLTPPITQAQNEGALTSCCNSGFKYNSQYHLCIKKEINDTTVHEILNQVKNKICGENQACKTGFSAAIKTNPLTFIDTPSPVDLISYVDKINKVLPSSSWDVKEAYFDILKALWLTHEWHCTEDQRCTSDNRCVWDKFALCNQVPADQRDECENCKGVWTAIGCIPIDIKEIVKSLLTLAISIAGGLSLLIILYGAFSISVSAGDPQKIQQGREIITAAITGLVFIIFSVIILQFIGVEILHIPDIQ